MSSQSSNFVASYAPDGALRWWRTPGSTNAGDFPMDLTSTGSVAAMSGRSDAFAIYGEGEPNQFTFPDEFNSYVATFDEATGDLGEVRLLHPGPNSFTHLPMAVDFADDGSMAVSGRLSAWYEFVGPLGTVSGSGGSETDPYVATFEADGDFQCAWVLESETEYIIETARAVWLDGDGGVWMAAFFSGDIRVAGGTPEETVLTSVGGGTDIVLARFEIPNAPPPADTAAGSSSSR